VAFDATAAAFLAAADSVAARRAIIDRSTGGRLPASWLDWKARYSWDSSDRAAFAAYFSRGATDFSGEVRRAAPNLPLLALVGEHDPRFDAALVRRTHLAWYPQARLEVLANAGHYPMNETPLALAASIEAFLRE
jgi:pimeloyl-ACP methyl ester carboxylesterase